MKMKKIFALILSVLMFMSISCVGAFAEEDNLTLADGIDALKTQFVYGEGPETNGYTIDYRYFSPVKENDDTKYPLVIWLHGMGDGATEGKQVTNNDLGYWTSAEFQSRFEGAEGAFIFAPRSLEEKGMYWDDVLIFPLRAAIDDFIAENAENVDLSRIYIGGYSMGGKMTFKMAVAYPEMFAAIFPICPAWKPTAEQTALFADLPVWLTSAKNDPIVNYNSSVKGAWDNVIATNNNPEACRFSTLEKVKFPDGSMTISSHYAWYAVTYDMFSTSNGDYPYLSTVNGLGETVTLTYPNGMISWLSQFTSDFDGTPATGYGNIDVDSLSGFLSKESLSFFFEQVIDFFKGIIEMLLQLFNF